jgi:DNA-binding CsgD family transcriptional regulator
LHIERGNQRLVIRLVLEPDRYQLMLEDQTQLSLPSLDRLGLSQRETEVFGCLIQGLDNQAIALRLSIGISTIRKHLENIYRKFGVQSKAALKRSPRLYKNWGCSIPSRSKSNPGWV